MTRQQLNEVRIVLQQIAITQAMFREAIARFERLASEAGHVVKLIPTDDFTDYEGGVTHEDLSDVLDKYKAAQ